MSLKSKRLTTPPPRQDRQHVVWLSGVILQGAIVTLELALSSVVLAVLIDLVGAATKLSQSRAMGLIFEGFTTVIRGVPDLSLNTAHLLRLQIALNTITDAIGIGQIDIDPMVAGIIALGFIYGAYFAKLFAVRLVAVPKAIMKPLAALRFTSSQIFRRIMFPAMMVMPYRESVITGGVILKATALVSLLGLEDVVKATQLAGKSTWSRSILPSCAGSSIWCLPVSNEAAHEERRNGCS